MPTIRKKIVTNFNGGGVNLTVGEFSFPELHGALGENRGVFLVSGDVNLHSATALSVPDANRLCYGVYLSTEKKLSQQGSGLVGCVDGNFFNVPMTRTAQLKFLRPTPIVSGVNLYALMYCGTGSYPGVATITLNYIVEKISIADWLASKIDGAWSDKGLLGLS